MEENKFTRKPTQDHFVTEKLDIIKNNLLGNYDDNGNYSIAPQIVGELLSLNKYRKSSYGNSMFCTGNLLGYGEIIFEVCFDQNTDANTQAKAKLYILEDVDKVNGYLQNTIKTLIAEFTSTVDNFIEESYKKFKISNDSDDSDEEGKEDKRDLSDITLDDSYILAKKAYMLLLDKLQDAKMLDAYGKLFGEKIAALTKLDSEFAKEVVERFNSQYALIENIFLKDKNYKALNELLDASVEFVSGTKEIFISQENDYNNAISAALANFENNINDLSQNSEKKALNMLGNHDREMLEEMIDSQNNREEFTDDIDVGGENDTDLSPTLEVFNEEILSNNNTDILDNPILYDKESVAEKDSEEEKSDTEEKISAEKQDISDIINENLITEEQKVNESEVIVDSTNISEGTIEKESKDIEDIIANNEKTETKIDDKLATEIKAEKTEIKQETPIIEEEVSIVKEEKSEKVDEIDRPKTDTESSKSPEEKLNTSMGSFREYLERKQGEINQDSSTKDHEEDSTHKDNYQREQTEKLQNTVNNLHNLVRQKDDKISTLFEELSDLQEQIDEAKTEETAISDDTVVSASEEYSIDNDYDDFGLNLSGTMEEYFKDKYETSASSTYNNFNNSEENVEQLDVTQEINVSNTSTNGADQVIEENDAMGDAATSDAAADQFAAMNEIENKYNFAFNKQDPKANDNYFSPRSM